jgi:hypothetical protein
MARPSKLTEHARERFLIALRAGNFPEVAGRYAGFAPASLYRYLRGETPEHAAFRDEAVQVQLELEIHLVGTIRQAAQLDARMALVLLERRFPERWGRRARPAEPPDENAEAPPVADQGVVLEPAFIEVLIPRLLAEGDRLRRGSAVSGHAPADDDPAADDAGRREPGE